MSLSLFTSQDFAGHVKKTLTSKQSHTDGAQNAYIFPELKPPGSISAPERSAKKSKDMTEYNIFGLFCRLICGLARYYTFVKGHCKK